MNSPIANSFRELIELKFQLYNSLFLTLPLDAVEQTGILLPLMQDACEKGLKNKQSPLEIIDQFFSNHKPSFSEEEKISFLFKIIQYVERQIVLIDALEDAAYSKIHRTGDSDPWSQMIERTKVRNNESGLQKVLEDFGIRVVLTAHPTQFYTGPVLGIISDLTDAIANNEALLTRDLLQQLGLTPFFQKQKPTAYDEATRLTWYLDHIFYNAIGDILDRIAQSFPQALDKNNHLITLGFWPGGDRDGNPFVTVETTKRVAKRLRYTILTSYFIDIKALKRRLSYRDIHDRIGNLEKMFYNELTNSDGTHDIDISYVVNELVDIEKVLSEKYQGLFIEKLQSFRRKIQLFRLHFASIDIRQDSRVISRTFDSVIQKYPELFQDDLSNLKTEDQINYLLSVQGSIDFEKFDDPVIRDTLQSFHVIKELQQSNGEMSSHRYIISNCRGPVDIARVICLQRLCGWTDLPLTVDVVPLFETIDDLKSADQSMSIIFGNSLYRKHLESRNNRQTVMLGFSDGTKDGGYLMANWSIFRAKENITRVSREAGIEVMFFDGRGGPPARGGGKTHLFYSALGKNIESKQIQMTVQGQTVSTHYGNTEAAVHNLSHLLTAGIENNLYQKRDSEIKDDKRKLIDELAESSYKKYERFKNHRLFIPYLEEKSTLKYYGMTNIGSRPVKRASDSQLKFEDLRAIPFVGAWSQLKQNVPGYYGVGTALKEQEDKGNLDQCIELYHESRFFRSLMSNSMQSMSKTNFEITRYMENDPKFGEFWKLIHDEYELSKKMVLKISGQAQLLEDNPRSRLSIELREKIVLPLLVVQQYALIKIEGNNKTGSQGATSEYENMVMRTLFGNINASRNSV